MKKIKFTTVLVICVIVISLLTACTAAPAASSAASSPAASTAAPAASTAAASAAASAATTTSQDLTQNGEAPKYTKTFTIGYAAFNVGANSYTAAHMDSFKARLTEIGVPDANCIILDAKGDASLQQSQIENLITKKVNVMIIWPVDGKAVVSSVKAARDAGIPVLIANSPIDPSGNEFITGYCGPDSFEEAKAAGEMMVEALGGKGNVVEITGLPGYTVTQQRHDGFVKAIEGTQIKLLDSQPGNWSSDVSQKVMETYLTKYPQIDGVYCADDGTSLGVMNALKSVNKNDGSIKITTATLFGSGYDAIKAGLEYGSVYQSPKLDAQITVDTAVRVGNGEKVPVNNTFVTPKVTKDNLSQFEKPTF